MTLFLCLLAGSLLVACGDKDAPPPGSGSDNAARGASTALAELDGVLKQKCSEACCGSDSKAASVCLKECKTDFWLDLDEGYKATVDLSADCPGQFVIMSGQERRYQQSTQFGGAFQGYYPDALTLAPSGRFSLDMNECEGLSKVEGSWVEASGRVTLKWRGNRHQPQGAEWSLLIVSSEELRLENMEMGGCGASPGDSFRLVSSQSAGDKG